jgi:hypothetical protein
MSSCHINEFAEKRRLKMRRDECGESIIPGKQGQIYEYGDGELGVMFMSGLRTKMWNKFRTGGTSHGYDPSPEWRFGRLPVI